MWNLETIFWFIGGLVGLITLIFYGFKGLKSVYVYFYPTIDVIHTYNGNTGSYDYELWNRDSREVVIYKIDTNDQISNSLISTNNPLVIKPDKMFQFFPSDDIVKNSHCVVEYKRLIKVTRRLKITFQKRYR